MISVNNGGPLEKIIDTNTKGTNSTYINLKN